MMENKELLSTKEKVDIYLKLLEVTTSGFEGRRTIEWTVLGLLWTGILVSAGFMKDNNVILNVPLGVSIISFILGIFLWLGFLSRANEIDKEFRNYYRKMIDFNLGIGEKPHKPEDVENRLKYPKLDDKWQLIEFFITMTLILVGLFINK